MNRFETTDVVSQEALMSTASVSPPAGPRQETVDEALNDLENALGLLEDTISHGVQLFSVSIEEPSGELTERAPDTAIEAQIARIKVFHDRVVVVNNRAQVINREGEKIR